MSNKEYLFESPEDFQFDVDGIGVIISSGKKAKVDLFKKTAEIEIGGEVIKLKNVDFNIKIERLDIDTMTKHGVITQKDLLMPDVVISGDLI